MKYQISLKSVNKLLQSFNNQKVVFSNCEIFKMCDFHNNSLLETFKLEPGKKACSIWSTPMLPSKVVFHLKLSSIKLKYVCQLKVQSGYTGKYNFLIRRTPPDQGQFIFVNSQYNHFKGTLSPHKNFSYMKHMDPLSTKKQQKKSSEFYNPLKNTSKFNFPC